MVTNSSVLAFLRAAGQPAALRFVLAFMALALLVAPVSSIRPVRAASPIEIQDVLGRRVHLETPAKRIVMGVGRHLPVLGLIHPDPVSLLVGWRADFTRYGAQYAAWRERFPVLDEVATIGGATGSGLPVESIIALKPDLVVLDLYDARSSATARSMTILSELGIPVLVVDFFSHPLENAMPSLRMLGRAIGTEERADAFARFYDERLERVRTRIAASDEAKPGIFMHVHAGGMPCCPTPGHGVFNDMIELAGGRNVALAHVPGLYGEVTLEQLMVDDPDIYIATGGSYLASRDGLVLGPEVSEQEAHASLGKILAKPGIAALTAVREGRAFGLWHMFNDTPAHIAMIEFLAKTFHPELFADLDPRETIEQINRDFLPVPMAGTYWVAR